MLPHDKWRLGRKDGEGRGAGAKDECGGAEEGTRRSGEAIQEAAG